MTRMRTVLGAAALTAALTAAMAGCGESPEAGVEKAFRGYHEALLGRDFATACSYNAPESTAKLLVSVRTQGIAAATCEDAFAAIYAESGPATTADGIGRSFQIQSITVDGDDATVAWSAVIEGEQRPASNAMHRTDGQWQLVAR